MAKTRTVPISITLESSDELTRTLFAPNATISTPDSSSAGMMANKVRSMFEAGQKARKEIRHRLNGIRYLFGQDVASPLERHLEEFEDCFAEMHYAHEETLRLIADERRADTAARQEIVGRLGETATELRRILTAATAAEEDRMARTALSRRRIPEWYLEAIDHIAIAEEPF